MSSLQDARDALDVGDNTTAQAIIADVLKVDQNNAEAWFLLSEAVEGDRKLIFLNKALKLNPKIEEEMQRQDELESAADIEPEFDLEFEDEEDSIGIDTITPADFDSFGQLEDEEFAVQGDEVEVDFEDMDENEAIPTVPVESQRAALTTSTSTTNKLSNSGQVDAQKEPSNLLNTVGLAVSVLLSVILFILFVQALLNLF